MIEWNVLVERRCHHRLRRVTQRRFSSCTLSRRSCGRVFGRLLHIGRTQQGRCHCCFFPPLCRTNERHCSKGWGNVLGSVFSNDRVVELNYETKRKLSEKSTAGVNFNCPSQQCPGRHVALATFDGKGVFDVQHVSGARSKERHFRKRNTPSGDKKRGNTLTPRKTAFTTVSTGRPGRRCSCCCRCTARDVRALAWRGQSLCRSNPITALGK